MDTQQKVLGIIKEITAIDIGNTDQKIRELGIDSIRFVQIIVKLEEIYGIEFPDEFLIFDEATEVSDLIHSVEKLLIA